MICTGLVQLLLVEVNASERALFIRGRTLGMQGHIYTYIYACSCGAKNKGNIGELCGECYVAKGRWGVMSGY